jgi:hypothetical protein
LQQLGDTGLGRCFLQRFNIDDIYRYRLVQFGPVSAAATDYLYFAELFGSIRQMLVLRLYGGGKQQQGREDRQYNFFHALG